MCKSNIFFPIVVNLTSYTFNVRASRPRFLRQGLSLTGLGDQAFDEIVTKIARAHGLFKRSLGDQLLDSSVFSAFKDFNTVDMGNRYFTSRSEAANDDIVKMESDVDPLGILQKAAGGDLVHCEDNQVLYFEKQIRKELSDYEYVKHYLSRPTLTIYYRFKKVSPAIFQIGDLVEVQVSMVALPQRGAKAKASLILRSISLMDSRFSQVNRYAYFKKAESDAFVQEALVRKLTPTDKPKEAQRTGLKRKVGYGEEQLSVARAKLTAMDIDADRGGNKGADVTNS